MLHPYSGENTGATASTAPEPTFSERLFGLMNETRDNLHGAVKAQSMLSDRLFGPAPASVNGPDERSAHTLETQMLNNLNDLLDLSRQVSINANHLNSRI